MVSNPKVTVAVANYNQGRYLGQCLDSLRNQTFDSYEVIVVDDGSTDGSFNVMMEKRWDKMRWRNYRENLGLTAALNFAIEDARGEYFVRLDADDYAMPTFLEELYRLSSEVSLSWSETEVKPVVMSYCSYVKVGGENIRYVQASYEKLETLQATGVMFPTWVMKKFKYNDVFWEEYDLQARLLNSTDLHLVPLSIPKCLWVYRRHQGNMTNDLYGVLKGWQELVAAHGIEVLDLFAVPLQMRELL